MNGTSQPISEQVYAKLRSLDNERAALKRQYSEALQQDITTREKQMAEDVQKQAESRRQRELSDATVSQEFHAPSGKMWMPVLLAREREIEETIIRDKELERNPPLLSAYEIAEKAFSSVLFEAQEKRWELKHGKPNSGSFASKFESSSIFYAQLKALQEDPLNKDLTLSEQKELAGLHLETMNAVLAHHRGKMRTSPEYPEEVAGREKYYGR